MASGSPGRLSRARSHPSRPRGGACARRPRHWDLRELFSRWSGGAPLVWTAGVGRGARELGGGGGRALPGLEGLRGPVREELEDIGPRACVIGSPRMGSCGMCQGPEFRGSGRSGSNRDPHKSWGNLYAWMIGIFVERFILVPSFENPDSSKLWGCRVERACSRIGLL